MYRLGPTTDRLELRALEVEDAQAFYELNSNSQVMRYTGEPPLASVAAARAAIESYPDFETVGYGRWGCYLKADSRLIGFCGLKYLDDFDTVDLGYRFLPDYWGQGLATEAGLASLRFGFDVLQLPRIIGLVLAENHASIRVLVKLGMQPDGELSYQGAQVLQFSIERAMCLTRTIAT